MLFRSDVTEPPLNTEAPTPTPEPTATPVPGYTAAPEPDYSVFDNSVFVGNSVFEGLYRYGVITHGKFMTKVGLNILSVYTDPKLLVFILKQLLGIYQFPAGLRPAGAGGRRI